MLCDNIDDSKVVEDVHAPSKASSIIDDISVGSDTPIIYEVHMSSDGTSDDMNELVEPNILAVLSKSFEFPCAEYSFMIVPIESYSSEALEFFAMIQRVISNVTSFGCLEFV